MEVRGIPFMVGLKNGRFLMVVHVNDVSFTKRRRRNEELEERESEEEGVDLRFGRHCCGGERLLTVEIGRAHV